MRKGKATRRGLLLMLTLALVMSMMPVSTYAASYMPDLNDKTMYYTPDYRRGDCVLSSAKSMMRRAAVMRGSRNWDVITNTTLRGTANTKKGLFRNSFSFTCDGITYGVSNYELSGNAENKMKDITTLLASHPEGIIVWGRKAATTGMHGVLVTGVSNGVLYAVDSTHNTGRSNAGIEPWDKTTMKPIQNCSDVWFCSSITGGAGASVSGDSTLSALGVRQPSEIKQGKGFTILGLVQSNYQLKSVIVSILDASGKEVICKSAEPKGKMYMLIGLDRDVKFGSLKTGRYTYRVAAVDEKKGYTVVHENAFNVVPQKQSKSVIAAVQAAIAPTTTTTVGGMSIKSVRAPSSVTAGRGFSIRGKIKSSSKIKNVQVQIVDAQGNAVVGASARPNKKSYNIKKLDRKVKFGGLAKGTYAYLIRAENGLGWQDLVYQNFTVQ